MPWHDDPSHPFAGIAAKLFRSEENIINLNSEIEAFFNEGEYPAIPEDDRDLFLRALEYHKSRSIPPRFSVLAGEIIHHFRSCFDHIVWHFSTGPRQNKMPIQFPVFEKQPVDRQNRERYEGNIQRITEPRVRDLIERMQPYHSSCPADDLLHIIHKLDIVDKHQEQLLCINAGTRVLPMALLVIIERYKQENPGIDPAQLASDLKDYGPLQPCIVLTEFGKRKLEPLTPALVSLLRFTASAVDQFAGTLAS